MLRPLAAAMLLLTAGGAEPPRRPAAVQYSQIIVREQIVVRVPVRLRDGGDAGIRWKEKKGPKCVPMRQVMGVAQIGGSSVDLILRDRSRLRAKLDSNCPALDYYYGFYVTPNPDGLICADRDVIRSRMGGECGIDKFRTLEMSKRD
ncbi:MAG: hypothetical protein QOH04_3078 [Sphingomonadales bacterium]|jgi:hypothetical protein|nr:hypothetical protein [Sphingomonadales bacterium]MEA3037287.1 hypothetical protein [Sphingomonadales bacterium]